MIEPKRVLRALAEHWTLLEPLCERFDAGTLSLIELRHQLAAQLPQGTPTDITALLDQWIRLDILVPVAKSPNRFELNAQIHDFLAYLRREHRLGLCLEIEAYLRHLERLAGHIQDAFEIRDGQDLARQLRLLDMRVRDVLKKLDNDEQALVAVAERAKTSDRQIPLRQRYAEVLATWDEYVEPMISPMSRPDLASEYPLVLTNAKFTTYIHSQLRGLPSLRKAAPHPTADIHPDTAAHYGVTDKEWMIIESPRGSIRAKARVTDAIAAGIVCCQHGWWQECKDLDLPGYDSYGEGSANPSLLIGADIADPISGSLPHRSFLCRVKPAE